MATIKETKSKAKDAPKLEHKLPQLNIMENAVIKAEGAFRRHFLDIERMVSAKGGVEKEYIEDAIKNLTEIVGTELYNTKAPVIVAPESADEIPEEGSCWLLNAVVSRNNFASSRMPSGIRMVYLKNGKPGAVMLAMPSTHEVFIAEKGYGAKGKGRLRVAGEKDLTQLDVFAFIAPYNETKHKYSSIVAIGEENDFNVLISGSFAYSVCEVAGGKADAIIAYNLTAGEIAFADLMIKEAGGIMLTTKGEKTDLYSQDVVIGSVKAVKDIITVI